MEQRVLVLVLTLHYRAPWCNSLKDKRAVVRAVQSALKNRFNVSVVESGHQDSGALFDITLAGLAFSRAQADSMLENLLKAAESATDAELYQHQVEFL